MMFDIDGQKFERILFEIEKLRKFEYSIWEMKVLIVDFLVDMNYKDIFLYLLFWFKVIYFVMLFFFINVLVESVRKYFLMLVVIRINMK